MSQASRLPDTTDGLPPGAGGTAPPTRPRRGLFRWILVPLLIAGVGFAGYRLGQTGTGGSAAQGSFAGGSGAAATSPGSGTGSRSAAGGSAGSAGSAGTGGASGSRTRAAGASTGSAPATGVTTPVQVTPVKAGTLSTQRRLTGTVSATQTTSVTAQTSGTVRDIARTAGQTVGVGQTVLTLSNSDLTTAVQSAENTLATAQAGLTAQQAQMDANTASLQQAIVTAQATLTGAQRSYAAMQQLYGVGALARTELDTQALQVQQAQGSLITAQSNLASNRRTNATALTNAQLSVQKAQIALRQARDAADAARVVAPYAGQITAMNVTAGQALGAGTAAFTLVSAAQQVKVNVPATEAASLPVGTALNFLVGQQTYPLKVVQNAGATTAGSVPVTARFTGAEAPLGAVGSVVYRAKVASGILVPSTALQADGDATYLYTVEGGRAKQRAVTVLGQAGTQSAVQGLESGAQVISEPPTGLLDGAAVTTGGAASSAAPGAGGPPGGLP